MTQFNTADAQAKYRYIITETAGPSSLDPLDADNTSNLPVARMIYASPLEASEDNQLKSQVLAAFIYDPSTRTMEWTVKNDVRFDDGYPITPEDVAFAVVRMAQSRPKFPVIESIQGIESWIKSNAPLKSYPSGITVSGNTIKIQFTKDVNHPMFRFCLELFSIIPKRCVDLTSGKITCSKIPSSGYYSITSQADTEILFSKRKDLASNISLELPEKILFEYSSPASAFDRLGKSKNENVVLAGNELQFSTEAMDILKTKMHLRHLPASRFASIQLHQKALAFKTKECRRHFANTFRKANLEVTKQPIEASLFTKVLPSFESEADLKNQFPLTDAEIKECDKIFSTTKIPWGYAESDKDGLFFKTLKRTFEILNVPPSDPIVIKSRADFSLMYASGEIAVFNSGSGFWALDPAGDLKMLFTPGLHKGLNPITEDKKLQDLLKNVDGSKAAYQAVNHHLYEEAKFNIYTHPRRFYVTTSADTLSELPFALTSPAPWQVFRVK